MSKVVANKIVTLGDAAGPRPAPSVTAPDGYRYLLVFRLALVNAIGFALVAAAYQQGLLSSLLAGDATHLSLGIVAVFLAGLALAAAKGWRVSRELNLIRATGARPAVEIAPELQAVRSMGPEAAPQLLASMRLRLSHRIAVVRQIADSLVFLGLIGTVIGFIIALSGVDPSRASDVSMVATMVATLIAGMSTALYTTLVGAVLYLWLMVNYRILATGTVNLINALVPAVESRRARA